MSFGICPVCGQEIQFQDTAQVGQNTVCPHCQKLLAIVTLNPIILELYQLAPFVGILKENKQETGTKNNQKNKNRFGEFEENDEKDDDWKREIRKSRLRKVNDW